MGEYYADSSVLVKRHVQEIGSDWFRALADPTAANSIIISRLGITEVFSAFRRRMREASLDPADYTQLAADFARVCSTEYQIVELTVAVTNVARALLERHALRAFDALQLASAQTANEVLLATGLPALTFLAADAHLLQAAQAEGLATDNPNNHP